MWRIALVLGVAGCGRFDFDAGRDAQPEPDSAFAPTSDAPPNSVRVRLGECANADVTGVTKDASIDSTAPTQNFGGRYEMRVGNGRVSLIRFDLAAIPPSATIFSATLEISVGLLDALEQGYVGVHTLHEDWDEGTKDYADGICNWTTRTTGVLWTTPGALAPGSASSREIGTFVPVLEGVRHEVALDASEVQTWLTSNHGMLLEAVGEGSNGGWLQTKEASDPAARPCLAITYVP